MNTYEEYLNMESKRNWSNCPHLMPPEAHPPVDEIVYEDKNGDKKVWRRDDVKRASNQRFIRLSKERAARMNKGIVKGLSSGDSVEKVISGFTDFEKEVFFSTLHV